jgi:hypothetical protein
VKLRAPRPMAEARGERDGDGFWARRINRERGRPNALSLSLFGSPRCRQQTTLAHSLPGVRLIARPSASTQMAGRSRSVRSGARRSRRMACAQGPGAGLPQYSNGRYDGTQHDAERPGRKIWKGSYVEPWLYRACIRANVKPAAFRMTQTRIPKASEHAAFILNLTGGSEI